MPDISHAEAVARAKKIAAVCADKAEKLRRLPPENVAATSNPT